MPSEDHTDPIYRLKKVGDNKSAPFTRKLTGLFTSATFIDELSVDPLENAGSATSTLLCLVEEPKGTTGDKVMIALVAVMPSTGEVVYDCFEDGLLRSGTSPLRMFDVY